MTEAKLELTHLDKIFWPKEGYTKGDLIEYYDKISSYILPYLKDRPESLNRHPDGIKGESFFHKNILDHPKWVKIVPMYSKTEEKTVHWLICNDKDTLLYMANLGCIEINPWNSRYQHRLHPDYLILDLDPEDVEFGEVIKTAKMVKTVLEELKIVGYLKTSGKRGLHILIPLGAKYTFKQTRQFAQLLAGYISKRLPDTTSVTRDPHKRQKRVYIDYLQNRPGQTLAAPYSLRPVAGATISTPLEWEELKPGLLPSQFTIRTIFLRLKKHGDPWRDLLKHPGIDMLSCLKKLEQK
jgi:bifunctional non-homologous end joining protein LigD